jgi:1-acyl-sn-glycerol-3-phosphate acyltransferase
MPTAAAGPGRSAALPAAGPITYLRGFLQVCLIYLWSAFWVTASAVAGLLTFNRELPLLFARRFWAPGALWLLGARLQVEPLPQVDWRQPHIFLMNHQSMADIPAAFAALPVNLRFIAKHTLRRMPFIGWYMGFTGMVFVNRSNRMEAIRSLALAGERIRGGANILAYPEGTRSPDGALLPFKKGPFLLALEAKVPIIPVAIEGSGRLMPRGGFRIHPGPIRVKVGAPILTAHRAAEDRDALLVEVRDAIGMLHRELGGRGEEGAAIAAAGVEGRGQAPTA